MSDLWEKTLFHLDHGNFSSLEEMLGGPAGFDRQITEWHAAGSFTAEPEMLAEALTCACMLGRTDTAKYLIEHGVEPYAGMKTWLAGPHYAVSGGHTATVKMLIATGVSLEIENGYGGTLLGQALWSAINEHKNGHAEMVERLIEAGAHVEPGTLEWWDKQDVPNHDTKRRIADVLRKHAEFHARVEAATAAVSEAESNPSRQILADALKALGNILRRPPFGRNAANKAYTRAADIYRELNLPLEEAWVKRHIGINHEYAERLLEAERYYDEALALYRDNADKNSLDYANTVRYPAVVKNRLGLRAEAAALWEEAHDRYKLTGIVESVAEAAAWLTIFAIEKDDIVLARQWFLRADDAAKESGDPATHKFLADVRERLRKLERGH